MEDKLNFNTVSLKPFKADWNKYFAAIITMFFLALLNNSLKVIEMPKVSFPKFSYFFILILVNIIFYKTQTKIKKIFESEVDFNTKLNAFKKWRTSTLISYLSYTSITILFYLFNPHLTYIYILIFYVVLMFLAKPNKPIFEKILKEEIIFED